MTNKDKSKVLTSAFFNFLLITFAFLLATLIKRGNLQISQQYSLLLLFFYCSWFVSLILSKKYKPLKTSNFHQGILPYYRSFLYMLIFLFSLIFILKLFRYSRTLILLTLVIYAILELLYYSVFYISKWGLNLDIVDDVTLKKYNEALGDFKDEYEIDKNKRKVKESFKSKIEEPEFINHYEISSSCGQFMDYMNSVLNLNAISASDSIILDSSNIESVSGIFSHGFELIGNLRKLNDIKRLDMFLKAVNHKLTHGGYFIGAAKISDNKIDEKNSIRTKGLFRFIQFWINGKYKRTMFKSEVMGRLIYSGFKLVDLKENNGEIFFAAKKIKSPVTEKSSSNSLFFRQKRIGKNGEIIYAYKLRTMHPYSEYAHKYLLHENGLGQTGKIEDDIRIHKWGRIFRKFWIDELPMILNLLQGDLKLIGLRPLSVSFLQLYPDDLKRGRLKLKPGLIPSVYAENPHSLQELWEAEGKYIREYSRRPLRTDILYFFKVVNNILFKRMRSG